MALAKTIEKTFDCVEAEGGMEERKSEGSAGSTVFATSHSMEYRLEASVVT